MRYAIIPALVMTMLLPFPKAGERGAYNLWSGLAWCQDRSACMHEAGHALDRSAGWISQSREFAEALQMYLLTGARNDDRVIVLLSIALVPPDGQEPTKKELYAWLFEMAGGIRENMPAGLRSFYDWTLAEKYISQIDGKGLYLWRN